MKDKLCSSRPLRRLAISSRLFLIVGFAAILTSLARAGDAPSWMHNLANVQLPEHDEKTDAILLYSETNVAVLSVDKIKTQVREAYKILRPEGRERGTLWVYLNSHRKVRAFTAGAFLRKAKIMRLKTKTPLKLLLQ